MNENKEKPHKNRGGRPDYMFWLWEWWERPDLMSQEQKEMWLKAWEICMPKLGNPIEGQIFIYGTGGESASREWKDLFCNPENYNFKSFNDIWDEKEKNKYKWNIDKSDGK